MSGEGTTGRSCLVERMYAGDENGDGPGFRRGFIAEAFL